MCYSDISALYGAREINTDRWPYASSHNSVEYPVLTGMVMWATGLLIDNPDGYKTYFDLNALLIILLLFASVFVLWRLKPEFTPLFPIAPAAFGSLFINWDIYAVSFALLALYFLYTSVDNIRIITSKHSKLTRMKTKTNIVFTSTIADKAKIALKILNNIWFMPKITPCWFSISRKDRKSVV